MPGSRALASVPPPPSSPLLVDYWIDLRISVHVNSVLLDTLKLDYSVSRSTLCFADIWTAIHD
jgi:hypothetical protein